MILFGAGSSVPLGIPGMVEFTERFLEMNEDITSFISDLKDGIEASDEMVGIPLSFDLETLLSTLNDLSGYTQEKPISLPTSSLLIKQGLTIKTARKEYENEARSVFESLRTFIFETCLQPIKIGREKGSYNFLDRFYGPLMTILNRSPLGNLQSPIKNIFSTNWDLCFKTWADYVSIHINDGTIIDNQSNPVLSIERITSVDTSDAFKYVPLHGSLDLIRMKHLKGAGSYTDISKVPDPIRYFEGKPENMRDIFMIYPLEAIGYEESVKSPYLDMLYTFRNMLSKGGENFVFIIGYSLRDPTIGSIFEEVITERIRRGDVSPLSDDLDSRQEEASHHRFKIIVIDPDPENLIENLKKQSNINLLETFIPIKIRFPKVTDSNFVNEYIPMLHTLFNGLIKIGFYDKNNAGNVIAGMREKYKINVHSKGLD